MATFDVGLQDTISEQKFKPCFCSVMPLFNESCGVPGDTEKNNAEQKSDQFAVCGISDTVYNTVYRKKYNERHAIQTSNHVTVWTDPSYINIGPYQYPLGSYADTVHHSESAHLSDGVPPSNRCYTSKDSLAKVEDPIHLYVIDDDANTFYDEIKINSPAESGELPQIWRNHDDACKEKQVQRDDNDNESETVYICTTSADSAIRYDSRVQYPIMNTTHSHVARPTEQTTLGLKLNQSGSHVTNMLNDRPTWYAKLPAYVDPFKPLANKHSPENNVTDVSDKSGILNANHTGYEEGNVEDCPKVKESPEETCIMVEECISCRDEKKKKKWLRPVLIALGATSASILVSAMTLLMIVHL